MKIISLKLGALLAGAILATAAIPAAAQDYTVTTTASAIVVTDAAGNADTLTLSEPAAGSIRFAAAGRSFSVDGGPSLADDSGAISLTGVSAITVDTGAGDDTLNVGSFTGALPSLTIGGGGGTDTVNLAGDVTFGAGAGLSVTAETGATAAGADVVTSGAGAILLACDNASIDTTSTLVSASTVALVPQTAGRTIRLQEELANSLSLTDEELDRVTAGTVVIGSSSSGAISQRIVNFPSNAITHAGGMAFRSGGTVNFQVNLSQGNLEATATGSITCPFLTVQGSSSFTSSGGIDLSGFNTFTGPVAAHCPGSFKILSSPALVMQSSTVGSLSMAAFGGITQTGPIMQTQSFADIVLAGPQVLLTNPGNQFAGKITIGLDSPSLGGGEVVIAATGALKLGRSLGSSTNSSLTMTTPNGDITVGTTGISMNSVILTASGNINSDADYAGAVTLRANGDVTFRSFSGQSTTDPINVTLNADRDGDGSGTVFLGPGGNLALHGGSLTIGGGSDPASTPVGLVQDNMGFGLPLTINTQGGNVLIRADGRRGGAGIKMTKLAVSTGGGSIKLYGIGASGQDGVTTDGTTCSLASAGGLIVINGAGGGSGSGVVLRAGLTIDPGAAGVVELTGAGACAIAAQGVQVGGPAAAGPITMVGDVMDLTAAGIQTTGVVTLLPLTAGRPIRLGTEVSDALSLTVAELDLLNASIVAIGNSDSGLITCSAVFNPLTYSLLALGQNSVFDGGGLLLEIGPTGASYERVTVAGNLSIGAGTGLSLTPRGGYNPALGQTFVVVTKDGSGPVTGTFNGLPEGGALHHFLGSALDATITYQGGDGNDVVLTVTLPAEIAVEQPEGSGLADGGSVGFGSQGVFGSVSRTFTVRNLGPGVLTGLTISKDGPQAGDFAIASGPAISVANGGTTTFTVDFTPTDTGPRSATIHFFSNDEDESPFDLTLTGTGLPPPPVGFSAGVYAAEQGDTVVNLTISRPTGSAACSVTMQTSPGTSSTVPPFAGAVAGTDYVNLTGAATTVAFLQGETTKVVPVTLIPRTGAAAGQNYRFTASLSAPVGTTLGTITTAAVHILAFDGTGPSLTITAPGAATVTGTAPYQVTGTAGDVRGISRVEVSLNDGPAAAALLGSAMSNTSVPWSLGVNANAGANTVAVTAFDLSGNSTTVRRRFNFVRGYVVSVQRAAPVGIDVNTAGTVTLTATPAATTTSAASANPAVSTVLPNAAVKINAMAKAGYVFSHWSGTPAGAVTVGNVVTFTMPSADPVVTATFVANPFAATGGAGNVFYGLVHADEPSTASNATEGFITGTLTPGTGGFSGKILIDRLTQSFAATFYGNGGSLFTVGTAKQPSLVFAGKTLTLSFSAGSVQATVTQAAGASSGTARRTIYSITNKVVAPLLTAPTNGFFTLGLPSMAQTPAAAPDTYPQGDGFATLTLSNLGVVMMTGTLADGTAVTGSSGLVAGDDCPIFAQLVTPGAAAASKGGSFGGVLSFNTAPADSDVSGTGLLWFRPAVTQLPGVTAAALATQLYSPGWPNGIRVNAIGALYNKTTTVQNTLGLGAPHATNGNGKLMFTDGKLTLPITKTEFNISGNVVTKIPAANSSFTLTLAAATGTFSGMFTPNWASPAMAKPAFKGILIQKGANKGGFGYFISNASGDLNPESGGVTLGGQP